MKTMMKKTTQYWGVSTKSFDSGKVKANPAPFPSMVVVFRGDLQKVAQGTTEGKMEGGAEC